MSVAPDERSEEEEQESPGFTVSDRRSSHMKEEEKAEADAAKEEKRRKEEKEVEAAREEHPLPEINFSTFVLSLGSTALVQLGEIEDPATGALSENFVSAKQTIDILGVLEEKTQGNLDNEETSLLTNLLYDLRMRYVNKLQGGNAPPS